MSARSRAASTERLPPDFADFIHCLASSGVEYVVVGAYALGVHGFIRATGDLDVFYRPTPANVRRLIAALSEFGAPGMVIDQDALLLESMVSRFGEPPLRIDLLSSISGLTFAEVWSGAVTVSISRQEVRVIGLAELRRNKRASGRRKDLEDLRRLDAVR